MPIETHVRIREARPDDCEQILAVHRDTLIHTYSGISPEEMRHRYDTLGDYEYRLKRIGNWIANSGDQQTLLVATCRDTITGVARAAADEVSDAVAVDLLYVRRPHMGQGIGSLLTWSMIEWAGHDREMWVGAHPSLLGYYGRFGFEPTGELVDDTAARLYGVVRLNDVIARRAPDSGVTITA